MPDALFTPSSIFRLLPFTLLFPSSALRHLPPVLCPLSSNGDPRAQIRRQHPDPRMPPLNPASMGQHIDQEQIQTYPPCQHPHTQRPKEISYTLRHSLIIRLYVVVVSKKGYSLQPFLSLFSFKKFFFRSPAAAYFRKYFTPGSVAKWLSWVHNSPCKDWELA